MDKEQALRVAVAVGTMHLPRMHFVVAHAAAMPGVDARAFAVSAENKHLSPIPVAEAADGLPLLTEIRRRLYPVASQTVGRALKRWRPEVVNLHFLALGGYAIRAASHGGVPVATTVHAAEPFLIDHPRTLRQRLLRDDARRALDGSHALLAVSGHIAQWLIEVGADGRKVAVEHLGIDVDFWRGTSTPLERHRYRRVAFVGHLTELKGPMDLIAVSKGMYPSVPHNLDIVGDGPLREAVSSAIRAHPHITWHGVLDRGGVRRILDRSSVLCLPTRPVAGIEDAAPTVLLEAQSMAVPVLTYKTGGTTEMVADPFALVDCGDLGGLDSKLTALLEDGHLYERMSGISAAWVRKHRAIDQRAVSLRNRLSGMVSGASESQ